MAAASNIPCGCFVAIVYIIVALEFVIVDWILFGWCATFGTSKFAKQISNTFEVVNLDFFCRLY